MKTYKIYTAGKMGGLSYDEQMKWRKELEDIIRSKCDKSLTFVHPPMFYQYDNDADEAEAKEWDIAQLMDSDIVVVDLATIADSIGTHIELGIIEAMNRRGDKHIHLVGVGKPNVNHPWIQMGMLRQEDILEDVADFIINYLLL